MVWFLTLPGSSMGLVGNSLRHYVKWTENCLWIPISAVTIYWSTYTDICCDSTIEYIVFSGAQYTVHTVHCTLDTQPSQARNIVRNVPLLVNQSCLVASQTKRWDLSTLSGHSQWSDPSLPEEADQSSFSMTLPVLKCRETTRGTIQSGFTWKRGPNTTEDVINHFKCNRLCTMDLYYI